MDHAGSRDEYIIMAGSPDTIARNYNLRGIDRRDGKAFASALAECDALVFPGGSIFQDVTSVKSVHYYHDLVKKAKKAGKKVILLGQGVGPVTSYFGKKMTADAFNSADVVAVRDPDSLTALQALGVKKSIKVTADCALLLPPPADDGAGDFSVAGMRSVGIVPRPFGKGKEVVKLFSELCAMLARTQFIPVLIEMDHKHDGPLIDEIEKEYGGRISHMVKLSSPITIQQRLARMEGLISMRLHGGILGATVGIAPLMVSYDPKTTSFAKLLGLSAPPMVTGLTAQRLYDMFIDHHKSRERNEKIMIKRTEELRALAETNVQLLRQSIGATATIGF